MLGDFDSNYRKVFCCTVCEVSLCFSKINIEDTSLLTYFLSCCSHVRSRWCHRVCVCLEYADVSHVVVFCFLCVLGNTLWLCGWNQYTHKYELASKLNRWILYCTFASNKDSRLQLSPLIIINHVPPVCKNQFRVLRGQFDKLGDARIKLPLQVNRFSLQKF